LGGNCESARMACDERRVRRGARVPVEDGRVSRLEYLLYELAAISVPIGVCSRISAAL